MDRHRVQGGAEAGEVEPIEADLAGASREVRVVITKPVDERKHFLVAPHPGWETLERLSRSRGPLATPNICINMTSVRPVGFDGNDGGAVVSNEPLRDLSTGLIKLGRAMGGITQQHNLCLREAVGQRPKCWLTK